MKNEQALAEIVGRGNVQDDPQVLAAYSRDQSFVNTLKPWFVVKPRNADQMQKLVHWANQTKTPLVPVSSGAPHFRGDTVPSVPGAVMVDLSDMKKIVHVDMRNRMVIVEPG